MKVNISPWIEQLKRTRPVRPLAEHVTADVAIIGGGIAGVATAFFVLRDTDRSVVLVEGDRIAHGATGHNGGQIVSYFERPFADVVAQYGMTKAAQAQAGIFSAWELLEEIYAQAHLQTPLSVFTGYAGLMRVDQLMFHLHNKYSQREAGLNIEEILVVDNPDVLAQIPEQYAPLYAPVPKQYILDRLETNDHRYIAALASRKGCFNSALFCEELIDYLLVHYRERFQVVEHTPVVEVALTPTHGVLKTPHPFTVSATRVVLCTNGFHTLSITNQNGPDINSKFHELVIGRVGYMAGFFEPPDGEPAAISYFNYPALQTAPVGAVEAEPYIYFTRRRFEHNENGVQNLICIGGPEAAVADRLSYIREEHEFPQVAEDEVDAFVASTMRNAPVQKMHYPFKWHGLMGYTPNGLRCIGPEPCNPVLLYNLGCNGVGLLPSIYGGARIAKFINTNKLEPSIFDPTDQRCPPSSTG